MKIGLLFFMFGIIFGLLIFNYFKKPQIEVINRHFIDTLIIRDTIKIEKRGKIIVKIDTIYMRVVDSIYSATNDLDSLFKIIATPFDTTIAIDTIGSLKLNYFPVNRELNYKLKLNPIEIKNTIIKDSVIIETENNNIYYLIGATLTGIIIGLVSGR